MYTHRTPSLARDKRPLEHIVWTYPAGVDLQTALANLHAGRCWCGGQPTRLVHPHWEVWACSRAHRRTWWQQFEFWHTVRYETMERDCFRCVLCGRGPGPDGAYVPDELHVDHIEAVCVDGAPWARDNLRTLCAACHRTKTAADFAQLAARRRARRPPMVRSLDEFA